MKKKKIKILHVAQAAGGVDRYIRMLLKYLDKEKFENILVCSQDFREKDYKNLVDFFEQVKMDRAIGSNDLKAIGEVRRLIKRYNPDIVYAHSSKAGAIARVADIGLKNHCLYNPHGWAFNMRCSAKKEAMYTAIEKIAAPFCDKIICIYGYNCDQIAAVLTQKKRSTLRGKQEWNGMMVANIMKNERRWGDLEARKSIVVDYKLGKVTKNNGNRCSAYVPEHHEAIVSPEIARAAHLVASSRKKCGVQDIVVIQQGTLKGFVGIHPNWSGISVESIRSLCLSTYLPEEVMKLNDIAEMRAGATLGTALQSEYMTVSGACFINQSSPVMTISKNGIRFSKACHSRLDDCEYVELLYHPILQVVILRKSNHGFSTAMHWRDDNDVHSVFSARAFSGLVFQTLNWKMNYRYQCRGICRGQGNAKFLIFELDESRILTGKNQYEQENCSMNLKCRLYRSKWVQSITVSDVMESGQVVENPMIGAIPSRNEVQRELDDLLMSM